MGFWLVWVHRFLLDMDVNIEVVTYIGLGPGLGLILKCMYGFRYSSTLLILYLLPSLFFCSF